MTLVIGSGAGAYPIPYAAPIIETADEWGDDWTYQPDLQLVSCEVNASSIRPSVCEFERRYGANVKMPFDAAGYERDPLDLIGTWVRLSLLGDGGPIVQFVGQVDNQARTLTGGPDNPAGKQTWTASGGLRFLQRITVSQAVFIDDGGNQQIVDWVPAMNARDSRRLLVGNRSDDNDDQDNDEDTYDGYFYGGTSLWTHLQYAQYLLDNFVSTPDGPEWTLGGQIDILDGMTTTIVFGETSTVADMLRELINPKYGIDYTVTPTDGGFEVTVFALTDQTASFGAVSMPSNPNSVVVDRTDQIDMVETHLVDSSEKRYDVVTVQGKRIVVCGTLWGERSNNDPSQILDGYTLDDPTLVAKWSDALEADYISAGGNVSIPGSDVDQSDLIRQRDKYRDVYRHLGAPVDWDLDGGTWAVACASDGTLTTGDYQTVMRETLAWLPLYEAYDYTTIPPTDNTSAGSQPDLKPPLAWIFDEQGLNQTAVPQYVPCDRVGVHVSTPHLDWGVFLSANPNHDLALNSWTKAQLDTTNVPLRGPDYDYSTAVATIALESDHRIRLTYALPADLAAGDGSVLTIEDNEAELWVVLPGTIVDCDKAGNLIEFGADAGDDDDDDGVGAPTTPTVVRDDTNRLALILAGVVSRYVNERSRGQIEFKGLIPWALLVGQILSAYQDGDDSQRVDAVITSINWTTNPTPRTVIRTGYA